MRRSHSVSETSVGLFAFLDVLMSTMGSLILVLIIVTPKIQKEKIARAATEAAKGIVKIEAAPAPTPVAHPRETIDLNAKFAARVAELSSEADEHRRAAADAQQAVSMAKERAQKVHAEREQLERRLARVHATKDEMLASVEDLSAEGVKVETELTRRASRLRKIRDQIAHSSTEYAFVAYDGVSGTIRRPILIECANDKMKFAQEGITLTSTDISDFTNSSNPLLAGAEALLAYWSTHSPPNEPKPYVLLVVRPSGTLSYYRARNMLERMRAPFGYELLPEDQKLAVPPPNAEATAACRRAIDKVIAKRDSVFDQVFATTHGSSARNPLRRGAHGRGSDTSDSSGGGGSSGKPGTAFADPFDLSSDGTKTAGKSADGKNGDGTGGNSLVASSDSPGGSSAAAAAGQSNAGPGNAGTGGSDSAGLGPNNAGAGGVENGTGANGTSANGTGTNGAGMNGTETAASGTGSNGAGRSGVGGGGGLGGLSSIGLGGGGGAGSGGAPLAAGGPGAGGLGTGGSPFGGSGTGGAGSGGLGPGGSGSGGLGSGTLGSGGLGSGNGGSNPAGSSGGGPGGAPAGGSGPDGANVPGGGPNGLGPGNTPGRDGAGNPASGPGQIGNGTDQPPGSPGGLPGEPQLAGGNSGAGADSQAGTARLDSPFELLPPPGAGTGPAAGGGTVDQAGTERVAGEAGLPGASDGLPQLGQPQFGQPQMGQSQQIGQPQMDQSQMGASQAGSPQFGQPPSGASSSDFGSAPSTPILQAGNGLTPSGSPGSPSEGFGGSGGGAAPGDPSSASSASSGQSDGAPVAGDPAAGATPTGESGLPGGPPSGGTPDGADAGGSGGSSSPGSADGGGAGVASLVQAGDDTPSMDFGKRHWGYSTPQANVGFDHDVTIWIGAHSIVVGGQQPIPINRAESGRRLAALVVPAMDRDARTWGRPPAHCYWVPNVKFVISPGGNVPYERLRPLIEQHGLLSTVEYRLELESPRQTFHSWVQ